MNYHFDIFYRIYLVHDELKDKNFELELSWVCAESNGVHERVPASVRQEAESQAKQVFIDIILLKTIDDDIFILSTEIKYRYYMKFEIF